MSGPASPAHRRKVSILYFEGCPNHRPAAEKVRAAVAALNLDVEVEEVELTTPDEVERLRFLGSPTVRVDGVDIEPAARGRTDYAMSCRLYKTRDGLPSREMLLAALDAAHDELTGVPGRQPRGGECCCESTESSVPRTTLRPPGVSGNLITTGGSLLAAMLSSACCWVPLLLVAFGASAAGLSRLFGPWRPLFITVAVTMLAASFYLTFVRRPVAQCCAAGGPPRGRLGRAMWWVSAVIVAAFVFFPQYIGLALGGSPGPAAPGTPESQSSSREFTLRVEGMHCEACATSLTATLSKVDGVERANVDYASRTVRVWASDEQAIERVLDAVRQAGFSGSLNSRSHTP